MGIFSKIKDHIKKITKNAEQETQEQRERAEIVAETVERNAHFDIARQGAEASNLMFYELYSRDYDFSDSMALKEMLIDDDQDCVWLKVEVIGGASCHVGYRSCFYRSVPFGKSIENKTKLVLPIDYKKSNFIKSFQFLIN